MHSDAPYFSMLLCLTPDDFTRQVQSAATQWVNHKPTDVLLKNNTLIINN
jgi:hypothetical protein